MKNYPLDFIAVLAVSFVVGSAAACADGPDDAATLEGREWAKPLPERVPQTAGGVTGEVPDDVMQRARAALQQHAGEAARDASIVVAQEVVWPSGALGCGTPGRNYQPLPVTGHQVVFRADGVSYDFRIAGAQVLLCESASSGLREDNRL